MKLLPAVVLEASKQSYKVNRLVEYCRQLDGTELQVIKLPPEIDKIPHPVGVEHAVRYAGDIIKGPWLYMEADSIPLKAGFLRNITEEYYEMGKLFMLPSLEGCPTHDVAAAIGVWPANLREYLPKNFNCPPWFDLQIYVNHKENLHLTKQILHRYGEYQGHRVLRRYEFPKDKHILTPEAVIFHADPTQSIIRGGLLHAYFHSGDLGDIIAALPIIKQQGGGQLIIGPHHTYSHARNPREVMDVWRFRLIQPLLDCQPYLKIVDYRKWNETFADVDFSTFRSSGWNGVDNLGEWQGRHVGRLELDMEKWLTIPNAPWTGRIVVSRSKRYHNDLFPWRQIAEKFGDRLLFVGLPEELISLQQVMGRKIERIHTDNLLDVARILAGAELHFANQSAPAWCTMGLGKTIIMEVWPNEANSIVKNNNRSIFAQTAQDMALIQERYLQ